MRNYIRYGCFFAIVGLMACGDEELPVSALNQLTKVSCYEQGSEGDQLIFEATVTYNDPTGQINSIRLIGEEPEEMLFVYSDGKCVVTSLRASSPTTEYTLSGQVIVGRKVSRENPLVNHALYVSDDYTYHYSGSRLSYTSWVTTWPVSGGGYESRSYPEYERYTWESNNVVLFAQSQDRREMRYEYGTQLRPQNFPLRVIGSYEPIGFGAVSPLNLLYGEAGRYLPVKAYTYAIPNPSQKLEEFTYSYVTMGDYVTQMTVDRKSMGESDEANEVRRYVYTFEYNYAKP